LSDQTISKSDLFPELKHNKLVDAAQRWITKYPFIHRVRLYKNPSYKQGLYDKYILIFETEKLPEKMTFTMLEFWGQFSEGPASGSDFEKDLMNAYEDDVPVPSDLYSLWRSSINQPGEHIFNEDHPEPFNTQSGISEKSDHWLLTECTMSKLDSNINIAELIENAKDTGYIAHLHIIHVLADDIKFLTKHLPYLWTRFGCDTIRGDVGDLSIKDQRDKRLIMFLNRIAYGFIDIPSAIPGNHNGFDPDLITKYSRVSGSDKPQQVSTAYLADRGYDGLVLKLDDLRAYLMKYAKGIPVDEYPVLLRQEPTDDPEPEDLGYCASQKKRCRTAVTEIISVRKREGKPPLSSFEWYDRPDLRGFQVQKNGGRITEKTFYSWFNDLVNPEKKHGPIKGTKRTK
jgi:hypothetical protein